MTDSTVGALSGATEDKRVMHQICTDHWIQKRTFASKNQLKNLRVAALSSRETPLPSCSVVMASLSSLYSLSPISLVALTLN